MCIHTMMCSICGMFFPSCHMSLYRDCLYRDTLQMIVSLQLVRRRLPRIDPMMPYHNNCAYFLVFSWISAATKHYDSLYFHSYIIK